ncbi:HAD-IIB family hydrolase [Acidianus sp. HS-5]|uniref:HAD-IIB family hydrolase n=1 Tax=Acidianus sp. HS-5 TaxID=2886040 RepID=UPI001F01808B|nr:HAD-IIB family hydrolase [Acidianus sp. HS-5]BDC18509.1 phosphoglycolate phosphatase [Acidianus sp. HS-5]
MIVFSDYDRTLAMQEDGFRIRDEVADRVNDFVKKGGKFFVVTGREKKYTGGIRRKTIYELSGRLSPSGWVLENGGIVLINNKKEIVLADKDWINRMEEISVKLDKVKIEYTKGETIIFVDNSYDKKDLLEKIVGKEGKIEWNTKDAMILSPKIDKGVGIDEVLNVLGKDISIGIGDAQNDIPLFKKVNIKVAVSNALPCIKEMANIVLKNPAGYGLMELLDLIEGNKIEEYSKGMY